MIVGAGVVGCYLGKLVGDCEIWEKSAKLSEKPCGGLLSKSGLESLSTGYKDAVVNEVRGARFLSPNDEFMIAKSDVQAYVIDRLAFQKTLAEEAESEGCEILYNRPWNGEKDEVVVGADGALSQVAKTRGVARNHIHTYQATAQLANGCDPGLVELHFGDFAPGFFGWLIPEDEKTARIGLGCDRGNPKEHFDDFIKRFGISRMQKPQSALIPVFDQSQKTAFGNVALVGDAAGQVKATTGGGIIFGCKCAEVLAGVLGRDGALQDYETGWRKQYQRDLDIHMKLRRFLDKSDYDELFKNLKESGLVSLMERYGDMDHPGRLVGEILKRPKMWRHLPKFLFV